MGPHGPSGEFARQANLASEACQKEIETAAAVSKMQIIGRCYPVQLRIAGIGTSFNVQPWIARGMKNAVNLGQQFLSRNAAQLTFAEGKVSLRIGGGKVCLEEKGYSGIDGRADEAPAAAGSWDRVPLEERAGTWTALLPPREREWLLGRQPRVNSRRGPSHILATNDPGTGGGSPQDGPVGGARRIRTTAGEGIRSTAGEGRP